MLFLLTCWGANPFLTRHLCSKSLFQVAHFDNFWRWSGRIKLAGCSKSRFREVLGILLLCSFGVPKSSLTRHLCINSLWVVPYILAHFDNFWVPNPFLTRAGCSKSRFREVLGILLLCSFGVPKSSLTRHLCTKSLWVVCDKMAQNNPFWTPGPFLTRAGCSKTRFRKVG